MNAWANSRDAHTVRVVVLPSFSTTRIRLSLLDTKMEYITAGAGGVSALTSCCIDNNDSTTVLLAGSGAVLLVGGEGGAITAGEAETVASVASSTVANPTPVTVAVGTLIVAEPELIELGAANSLTDELLPIDDTYPLVPIRFGFDVKDVLVPLGKGSVIKFRPVSGVLQCA